MIGRNDLWESDELRGFPQKSLDRRVDRGVSNLGKGRSIISMWADLVAAETGTCTYEVIMELYIAMVFYMHVCIYHGESCIIQYVLIV